MNSDPMTPALWLFGRKFAIRQWWYRHFGPTIKITKLP